MEILVAYCCIARNIMNKATRDDRIEKPKASRNCCGKINK